MIPTVEEILLMLIKGECTHEQAMAWMEEHFSMAMESATPPALPDEEAQSQAREAMSTAENRLKHNYALQTELAGLRADAERYKEQRHREWLKRKFPGGMNEQEWKDCYDLICDQSTEDSAREHKDELKEGK